jgi:3-hydroxybutyryl-CoA dehydratase
MLINKDAKFEVKFIITEEIYTGFIKIFGDKNPLHVDVNYASQKGFRACVMHGNILNGFLSYFIGEKLPLKNVIIQKQEIKYYTPVYLHDELTLHVLVDDIYDSVNTVEFNYKFLNQFGVKVAAGLFQIGLI